VFFSVDLGEKFIEPRDQTSEIRIVRSFSFDVHISFRVFGDSVVPLSPGNLFEENHGKHRRYRKNVMRKIESATPSKCLQG
jgi:hypothetical protein